MDPMMARALAAGGLGGASGGAPPATPEALMPEEEALPQQAPADLDPVEAGLAQVEMGLEGMGPDKAAECRKHIEAIREICSGSDADMEPAEEPEEAETSKDMGVSQGMAQEEKAG